MATPRPLSPPVTLRWRRPCPAHPHLAASKPRPSFQLQFTKLDFLDPVVHFCPFLVAPRSPLGMHHHQAPVPCPEFIPLTCQHPDPFQLTWSPLRSALPSSPAAPGGPRWALQLRSHLVTPRSLRSGRPSSAQALRLCPAPAPSSPGCPRAPPLASSAGCTAAAGRHCTPLHPRSPRPSPAAVPGRGGGLRAVPGVSAPPASGTQAGPLSALPPFRDRVCKT